MIFSKKENAVDKLIEEHLTKVEAIVKEFDEMYRNYLLMDRAFKEDAGIIDRLEHEADQIRRQILREMAGGAFLPIHREDYMQLVEQMDDVANATEKTSDFLVLTRPFLPDFLREECSAMVTQTVEMLAPLRKLILSRHEKTEIVLELCEEIEAHEKAVDEHQFTLTKTIFKSDLDYALKLHLKLMVDHIASISDLIEDLADRVQVMAIKRPT